MSGFEKAGSAPERIESLLRERFAVAEIRIEDFSGEHEGHAGAREGGHYRLVMESPDFAGMTPLARQRAVNAAVEELFGDGVHALSMRLWAPGENRDRG